MAEADDKLVVKFYLHFSTKDWNDANERSKGEEKYENEKKIPLYFPNFSYF